MVASAYLQPADYSAYGIADAADAQVATASRMIDAYLGRPEGLLWSADANGQPAWMTGMTPSRSFALAAPVQPGTGVQITVPFAQFGYQTIGDVVIFDRTNNQTAEVCVVSAASGNVLTLDTVQFAHGAQATLEFGLTISEEVPVRHSAVRASRSPVVLILSGFGRFRYSREMRQLAGGYNYYESLLVTNYGQAGASGWNPLDISTWDLNSSTGVIRTREFGSVDVRLNYIAGWQYATLPEAIKRATGLLARNAIDSADLPGNVRMVKSGDGAMEKFRDSVLDSDTRSLLQPFKSVRI